MRIHSLQHVPFEDLANIEVWAGAKGHEISKTLLFRYDRLPENGDFDWLIVMGGPMGIYDEDGYPWLIDEKRFIERTINDGKTVLGVCLGAQLIAGVLGAKVKRNTYREIGWFPVSLVKDAGNSGLFHNLPERFTAFHWHGDTFEIPPGARCMASSEGCANQAFEYDGRVVGLQFHLESSEASIKRLIDNCSDEIVEGKYIQKPDEMINATGHLDEINSAMKILLNNMEAL
ncbi:GMP synthase [glutamine-hydrolyzing] [bacterium BMS3Abin07]|nr:GMP synthase [glutamine-hydrolyzing] [bacterium BMS3Abin07]GBE31914.1 GMP synthase [glutamine-hydrolyzing] [bacterium BMS3Bbin05]HDL20485.1 type 1 glutamine amidotransferase [Nitrospirota bacterium]HDZ87114.1 type 1 glutamine amidotransferase [Nitrospirota bacterium]